MGKGRLWTRDELILAINLYCKTPFGRIHTRNPEIVSLAERLGRSPGSVNFKLANFASIDPSLDRKGFSNVSKLDREVWAEFFENWTARIMESELRFSGLFENHPPPIQQPGLAEEQTAFDFTDMRGDETARLTKHRLNQHVFRKMVLSSYDGKCCITGIDNPEVLTASHIVPWAKDEKNRLNPMNGLCLNALHDKAFDRGLLTIDEDYRLRLSKRLTHPAFTKYDRAGITLPGRFLPDQDFLEIHRTEVFEGQVSPRTIR